MTEHFYDKTLEYEMISKHYGDQVAKRSGVRLMNHIDEGIEIMYNRGYASDPAVRAYIVHPLFQGDEALTDFVNYVNWFEYHFNYLEPHVVVRAMEYRRAANAYLCKPSTDNWNIDDIKEAVGFLLPDIREMLIADKLQNQKDFLLYHYGTHARSDQLDRYFKNWLEFLDVKRETESEKT